MSFVDTKILEINQYQKSDQAPFIIYADPAYLIEKIGGCKYNPEKFSRTKISEHIPSFFLISTLLSFKSIENKHDVYRGKDSMKNFYELLRENAMKIINFKKKKMKLLTNKLQNSYQNWKICYICKEKFENEYVKAKKHSKVRDHCHYIGEYRGAAHRICDLKHSVPKKFLWIFIKYHFILKKLPEKFEKQFTCLGEKTEKIHNLFSSNRKTKYKNW